MLHLQMIAAYFTAGTILLFSTLSEPAYSHSQPLFYALPHSIACDTAFLTKEIYSLKDQHTHKWENLSSYEVTQGHCHVISSDQLWEKHYSTNGLSYITGISPSSIETLQLYIPFSQLNALEPSFSPLITPSKSSLFLQNTHILPPDLPLALLEVYAFWFFIRFLHKRQKAWKLIKKLIYTHQETLFRRRRHLLTPNSYGTIFPKRWYKEKDLFCQTVLKPALDHQNLLKFWPHWKKRSYNLIETRTTLIAPSQPQHSFFNPPEDNFPAQEEKRIEHMSALEYEKYCAQILRETGWNAHVTPVGSDQGADIIATRNGIRLIVQCKLYSRPVGNKAVQEVFTACQYQQGHLAVVVSNANYTRHARQLAQNTGVYLLHHRQLRTLDESTPQAGQAAFI